MSDETHNEAIRRQFTKRDSAYCRLNYVHDDATLERVVKMTRVSPNDRVVDFACGPGYLAMAYAKVCLEVVGIDLTPAFLEHAKTVCAERGLKNVHFLEADAYRTELGEEEFDLAISRAAFHHFNNPEQVLDEMIRVTKPGGKIAVLDMIAPDDPAKASRHHDVEQLCDPTHVRALTEDQFSGLFRARGLNIDFQRAGETEYSLDDWIDHGGPSKENERRIREIFKNSVQPDLLGLRVREVDGAIRFAHPGLAIIGTKQPS